MKILKIFLFFPLFAVLLGTVTLTAAAAETTSCGSFAHRAAELLVVFVPGVDAAARAAVRARYDAELLAYLDAMRLERWRLPAATDLEAARAAVVAAPEVETAELNYLYRPQELPNDPYFDRQWYLGTRADNVATPLPGHAAATGSIGAPAAWMWESGSPAVVIAVIDSGVAFDHPDLVDNIWCNPGEIPDNGWDDDGNGYVDDLHGWDFVNDDANPSDYSRDLYGDGHGTHVAGIIAARGNNRRGTAGVMWRAAIMPLQIFDIYKSDTYEEAVIQSYNIIAAFRYAVDNGARIINCSFGGPAPSAIQENVLRDALEAGVLVVAAAGNDGRNNDISPVYPASYDLPNIVAVASVDDADEPASYSNYGAYSVAVAAPGGGSGRAIYSTLPPARTILFSEDFEAGGDAWITWSRYENWTLTDDLFGSRVVQDSVGSYWNNEESCIETTATVNAADYRGVLVQFRARYELEEDADFLTLTLSPDGVSRTVIDFLTGMSNGWVRYLGWWNEENLGGFRLGFCLETDGSVTGDGVCLDDIEISGIRWEFNGTEYGYKQGTSMACPVVSGIAGLVRAVRPDLDAVAVRRLIIDSVDSLPALAGVVAAGGRVNAGRAVAAATGTDDPDGGGWWRYLETVQRFYVAYYHRPADPGGLLYWSSYLHAVGGDTTEMVAAFANSNEAMARYGEITAANIAQVVDDIYQAAFGRDAEPAGRRYYVDGFNVGTFTPATIMLNVIDGARGEDALVLRNRLRAADDFTFFIDPDLDGNDYCISYSGEEDVLAAREFLAAVTADDNTLPTHAELTAFMRTRINEYPLPASR